MGNTVYVITQGSYSDYHICAVTLDKERAKKLSKFYADSDGEARIEEFDLGDPIDEVLENLVPVYRVVIERDGKSRAKIFKYHDGNKPFIATYQLYPNDLLFSAILTAKDEDHAIKIALDNRAKKLAEFFGL